MNNLRQIIVSTINERADVPSLLTAKATFGKREVKQPEAGEAEDHEKAEWTGDQEKPKGALARIRDVLGS